MEDSGYYSGQWRIKWRSKREGKREIPTSLKLNKWKENIKRNKSKINWGNPDFKTPLTDLILSPSTNFWFRFLIFFIFVGQTSSQSQDEIYFEHSWNVLASSRHLIWKTWSKVQNLWARGFVYYPIIYCSQNKQNPHFCFREYVCYTIWRQLRSN